MISNQSQSLLFLSSVSPCTVQIKAQSDGKFSCYRIPMGHENRADWIANEANQSGCEPLNLEKRVFWGT